MFFSLLLITLWLNTDVQVSQSHKNAREATYIFWIVKNYLPLFSNRQRTTSFTIWHNRLGHCSSQTVEFLAIRKLILVNDKSGASSISSACQLGKSKRLPFVIDVNKSGHAFDMVYCDLWGLALIQSWNNYKYCVSFVDDCTRFMWYYPLRNKAEFFQVYLLFEKMIYT